MLNRSPSPLAADRPADNVVWLEKVRHQLPRRSRSARLPAHLGDSDSYPSLYIFPAWHALRDSVGG